MSITSVKLGNPSDSVRGIQRGGHISIMFQKDVILEIGCSELASQVNKIALLSLPDINLLSIIDYLQTDEIRYIWKVSRRARTMAIPICVIRHASKVGYPGNNHAGAREYLRKLYLELDMTKSQWTLFSLYAYKTSTMFNLDHDRTLLRLMKASQQEKDTYLLTYAELKCSKLVKLMVLNKADPFLPCQGGKGSTTFHLAVGNADRDSVAILLQAYPKLVHKQNYCGETPLFQACSHNKEGSHKVVQLLLQARANPCTTNIAGETPLHCAARCANADNVRLLLENQAQVNARSNIEMTTALYYACCNTDPLSIKIVDLLLQYRADPFLTSKAHKGFTPLQRVFSTRNQTREHRASRRKIFEQISKRYSKEQLVKELFDIRPLA